eukprot:1554319-Pyramimonas_sp.AAC.1
MEVRRACSAVVRIAAKSSTYVGHMSPVAAEVASMTGSYAMHHSRGEAVPPIPMERSRRLLGPAQAPLH